MCTDCPARLAEDVDAAFPGFLAHHQDLVYRVALRMTGRPADAEDLAQEAFIRAYGALRTYDADRLRDLRPRGWLATIVTNAGRNRARRRSPATTDLEEVAGSAPDHEPGPERLLEEREAAAAWRRRLDALPVRYRQAVELRHVDGLSYPELAAALERPLGTVKSDVHRGVRLLRAAWQAERQDGAGREVA